MKIDIIEYLYDNYKNVSKGKKSYDEFINFLKLIDFTKLEDNENED